MAIIRARCLSELMCSEREQIVHSFSLTCVNRLVFFSIPVYLNVIGENPKEHHVKTELVSTFSLLQMFVCCVTE